MIFNEIHQLILSVWFSWDDHWIIHERFMEVNLIELQVQSLGNLSHTTKFKTNN